MKHARSLSGLILLLAFTGCASGPYRAPAQAPSLSPPPSVIALNERRNLNLDGLRFVCQPDELPALEKKLDGYFESLGIKPSYYTKKKSIRQGALLYTLKTPKSDTNTLNLKWRPEYEVQDEILMLPGPNNRPQFIPTVSRKEIVLSMMQHGRLTELRGKNCDFEVFTDNVGVRQNIVAWVETADWIFPDGRGADYNPKYWIEGTPVRHAPLAESVNDVFVNQKPYAFGCMTASKMVFMQGILDYFTRIKPDPAMIETLEKRLWIDGDPIVDVDPDYEAAEFKRPGKLLTIEFGVAPKNFIPGDWVYMRNDDPMSREKAGYEGSNAIYMGRNRFDDYYNQHHHYYTFEEKMDEVWNWRNTRADNPDGKAVPLSTPDFERLALPPSEGGIVRAYRIIPYFFGGEPMPEYVPAPPEPVKP